ncbi:MAG: hypothetical protein ACREDO_08745 [Methyloceanibacter sp.]
MTRLARLVLTSGLLATAAIAGEPAVVLPEAMFATGDGCKAIKTSLPEELEEMDLFVLSDTELMGQDFVCHFKDAKELATNSGNAWTVKASCESGAPAEPGSLMIKEIGERKLDVTLTTVGDPDNFGTFVHCPNPLTD